VERVWIEKDEGSQRPSGKPACEATMVQRAVALRWEAIDEQDCSDGSDGSDGLRPGRSPHEARHALRERGLTEGSSWIVEAEVSGDFERIARTQ
jgi:hypothetical protein